MAARALLAVAVVAGCGKGDTGKETPRSPEKHDAAIAPVDWAACNAALAGAPALADTARATAIIAGCPVCGDWRPLIDWGKRHEDGGPARSEIEAAMLACNAYCGADSSDRFMGTLDNARGTGVQTPWRWLAKTCKDKVSAVPDERFSSPQLFALDRIARAVAAHGGAAELAGIHLVLPAVSITGSGLALATAHHLTSSTPVQQMTVTTDEVRFGPMPQARLTDHGVAVDLGDAPYPGALVADLKTLHDAPYALFAPRQMAAARVADVIAKAPLGAYLAALPTGTPPSWAVPSTIQFLIYPPASANASRVIVHVGDAVPAEPPLAPLASNKVLEIRVRPNDTVEQLAATLDAAADAGWHGGSVVRDKAP